MQGFLFFYIYSDISKGYQGLIFKHNLDKFHSGQEEQL